LTLQSRQVHLSLRKGEFYTQQGETKVIIDGHYF